MLKNKTKKIITSSIINFRISNNYQKMKTKTIMNKFLINKQKKKIIEFYKKIRIKLIK